MTYPSHTDEAEPFNKEEAALLILLAQKYPKAFIACMALLLVAAWVSGINQTQETKPDTTPREDTTANIPQSSFRAPAPAITSGFNVNATATHPLDEQRIVTADDKSEALALFERCQSHIHANGTPISDVDQYIMLRTVISRLGGYDATSRLKNIGELIITQDKWDKIFADQSILALQEIRKTRLTQIANRKPADMYDDLRQFERIVTTLLDANKKYSYGIVLEQAHTSPEFIAKLEMMVQAEAFEEVLKLSSQIKTASPKAQPQLIRDMERYTAIVKDGPDKRLSQRTAEMENLKQGIPAIPLSMPYAQD